RQKQSARLEKSSKWKRSRKRLSSSAKTDANSSSSSQEAAVCLTSQLDQLVNGLTGWLEGVVVLGRRNTKQKKTSKRELFFPHHQSGKKVKLLTARSVGQRVERSSSSGEILVVLLLLFFVWLRLLFLLALLPLLVLL